MSVYIFSLMMKSRKMQRTINGGMIANLILVGKDNDVKVT